MANRLSEETLSGIYEGGLHLPKDPAVEAALPVEPTFEVDLGALLRSKDPKKAVQSQPPQKIYHAIQKRGAEDSLDILRLLSDEQIVRIFDYDVWEGDKLDGRQALRWLEIFRGIHSTESGKRFCQLDEEYQLAILGPYLRVCDDEEYQNLPDVDQDRFQQLPCRTLYYSIKTDEPFLRMAIDNLIESCLAVDVSYTYSLIGTAAFVPPNEQEHQIAQFRKARLEEDGFVSYEESLRAFAPIDFVSLARRWQRSGFANGFSLKVTAEYPDFLAVCLKEFEQDEGEFHQAVTYLCNALCTALKVRTDDLQGLTRTLRHCRGLISIGLENLAGRDPDVGREILKSEHPKTLFRVGLSLIYEIQGVLMEKFLAAHLPGAEEIARYRIQDRRGALLDALDRFYTDILGYEDVEVLKGIFNRLPARISADTKRVGDVSRHFEESDSADTGGYLFSPVSRLEHVSDFARWAEGCVGKLDLWSRWRSVSRCDVFPNAPDIAKDIKTAFAHGMLREPLSFDPLDADQMTTLMSLPSEALGAITADIFAEIEDRLKRDRVSEAVSIGDRLGFVTWEPIDPIMNQIADLVMDLRTGIEAARDDRTIMDGHIHRRSTNEP